MLSRFQMYYTLNNQKEISETQKMYKHINDRHGKLFLYEKLFHLIKYFHEI